MNLSSELVSQLVKVTNDEPKTISSSTVYGTAVVEYDGTMYVRIDGSDLLTPISTTAAVKDGERVTVTIENHTATITGNLSSPSARTEDVKEVGNSLTIFENVTTQTLDAQKATIDSLSADNLVVKEAVINDLTAEDGTITNLSSKYADIEFANVDVAEIDKLKAAYATIDMANINFANVDEAVIKNLEARQAQIHNLEATYGDFVLLTTDKFVAVDGAIENLKTNQITTDQLDANYANIEFTNIEQAAIENLFAKSGIIGDLVMSDGKVTGTLVGVTIKGDLIEAGTLKADKLVIKGEDGLYYKLNVTENGDTSVTEKYTEEELQNGILGSVIVANSITAEKISVDDLVAFDATIGGFKITKNSLYSGVKSSVDNTTHGIYLDDDGQFIAGDSKNYIKYYKADDENYILAISAGEIVLSATGKTVEETVEEATDIQIGARNLIRNSKTLAYDEYYFVGMDDSGVLGIGLLGLFTLGNDSNSESIEVASTESIEVVEATETTSTESIEVVETTETTESSDYTLQGFKDGMTLHDHHLIAMENAIIKALNGVPTARIATIYVPASGWSGSGTVYSQAINVDGITANSKIDLLPSPEQMIELLTAEISLTAVNSDGYITVFALGNQPSSDLELQAMITEVIIPEVSS